MINMIDFKKYQGNTNELSDLIKENLETEGYFLVRNFNVNIESIDLCREKFATLCEKVGTPVSHDRNNTIIWDIKSSAHKGEGAVITYSEHNHEAELHTDSQYSATPEDYFALLTLKKAECGGGVSYLLSADALTAELEGTDRGAETLEILRTTEYPFIFPTVFKVNADSEPEVSFGKILYGKNIRFRVDTIQKALDHNPSFCTAEQIAAFQHLVSILANSENIEQFYLEPKDLIFINNTTMLHGRSAFTDQNRHLLRIRMRK